MRKLVFCLAATAMLAACGGNDGAEEGAEAGTEAAAGDDGADGAMSQAQIAAEAASGDAMVMRAGQWEQTVEFTELDMPGLPEGMREMVTKQMGGKISTTSCLTEEEANQPNPEFFNNENQQNCSYQQFDRSGGRMTLRMTCDAGQGGGKVNVAMDGEFSGDSFTLSIDNKVTGTPQGDVSMKGTVTGRRIGDC